ncbi:HNH endonuclease [Gordonia phage Ligma]|nr:HNH endonuclease [Gordonia phage Ligma]
MEPTPSGCLVWTGATARKGYGVIRWRADRMTTATRVSWELEHGRPPAPDELIRHTCDNPPCVNPAHLLVGDHADNSNDMHDRNPNTTGEGRADSKLTYAAVDDMRRRYRAGGSTFQGLADEYGVALTTARDAVTGLAWRRGPSEPPVHPQPRHKK